MAKEYELKPFHKVVGEVKLQKGERAFVLPNGKVIATDTTNENFKKYQKERQAQKQEKQRTAVTERVKKKTEKMEKKQQKMATIITMKLTKKAERMAKQELKAKAQLEKIELEKIKIQAQLKKE